MAICGVAMNQYRCRHCGKIVSKVELKASEMPLDLGAIATAATTAKTLKFEWDGVDSVRFYVDGVLKVTKTDNGTTVLIPDDEALTPTICVKTSAAQVVTAFVDYIYVAQER
jgi:hypothetical protein